VNTADRIAKIMGRTRYRSVNPAVNPQSCKASLKELMASTEPADLKRITWIKEHEAEFDYVDCECFPFRWESKDQRFEGWGDTAREAVDSCMDDCWRMEKGTR
jgi:hypothetical protein